MKILCDCEQRDEKLVCDCRNKKQQEIVDDITTNEIIKKDRNDSGKWIVIIIFGLLLTFSILKHYAII